MGPGSGGRCHRNRCAEVGKRLVQVLDGAGDHAQRIGVGVEVDTEAGGGSVGQLDQLTDKGEQCQCGVHQVQAALVAEALQQAVLRPEIEVDQSVVAAGVAALCADRLCLA